MTVPFFAHCLLKLIEGSPLTEKELGGIEQLKQVEVEKPKKTEKAEKAEKPKKTEKTEKAEKAEKAEKPKKEKAEAEKAEKPKAKKGERRLDLPDESEIFTTVAGTEFVCTWNQEDQSFIMDGKTYTSPTAWVKACIVLQKGEAYSINGWAAAYIKNKDKRVYLKNL
jgi:hypothetical protein